MRTTDSNIQDAGRDLPKGKGLLEGYRVDGEQLKVGRTFNLIKRTKSFPIGSSVAPDNIEIFTDLGIMYLKINEVDRAYDKLQEAIALNPRHTNSLLALGAIVQTKNESEAALNIYRNISAIQDEGFELWNNVGMCFYRKNKLIAVISSYNDSHSIRRFTFRSPSR